jgi:hypothetical protein
MPHKIGDHVTVFTADGTDILDDITRAKFIPENKIEEGKGVGDLWDEPEIVGKNWRVEAECEVSTVALLTTECVNDGYVVLDINTGANRYQGNAVVQTAPHTFERDGIQKQDVTFLGRGLPTLL